MSRPDLSEITQGFLRGRNCCQSTLSAFSDETGYDIDETEKIAAVFGGGMELGETCGAVTGALMVIGMITDSEAEAKELAAKYVAKFKEKFGTTMCRELIKYDMSLAEEREKAVASGVLIDTCPKIVDFSITTLDELINE